MWRQLDIVFLPLSALCALSLMCLWLLLGALSCSVPVAFTGCALFCVCCL